MNKIYTGFVSANNKKKYANLAAQEFFDLWYLNTRKYAGNDIEIRIFGPDVPDISKCENTRIIAQYENLGHVGDYINNKRFGRWCGWTAGVIYGMMDAYVNNVDFIYKEQDCLAFGDWINQIKIDNTFMDITYGECKIMGIAQSLFYVKRNAIPDIIASLAQDDDSKVLPEHKFLRLPVKKNKLSFGYDRDRPFNPDDKSFYIQQVTENDLAILKEKGLI